MKNYVHVIFVLIITTMMYGCANPTYTYTDAPPTMGPMHSKYVQIGYEDELKPIEDVGIVTTDSIVNIRSINDRPIESFNIYKKTGIASQGRYQLHLLPGTYTLSLSFRTENLWSTSNLTKKISITKGQILHLSWVGFRNKWNVEEHDGSAALDIIRNDFIELSTTKQPISSK
jgi:hypothetical protein